MNKVESVVNVSVPLNVLIILIGVVIMILDQDVNSDLSMYSLSLTVVALLSILLTLLNKKNNEVLLSVIMILLALAQVVGGILKIVATERKQVSENDDTKEQVTEKLCYALGGLSLLVGMSLFSVHVHYLK